LAGISSGDLQESHTLARLRHRNFIKVGTATRVLDLTKELIQIPCMPQSTLTSKNQTTIPKAVVEALHLKPSDQLVYEIESDGRIILSAKTGTFASVAAKLPAKLPAKVTRGPARTVEEMKTAVKAMAVERMSRTRS
jgi:AbrB family looped-hinge helix DNA binding protein